MAIDGYASKSNLDKLKEDGLDKHDGFFKKAAKFAAGGFDAINVGKLTIKDAPEGTIPKHKLGDGKLTGFEDRDNDGNELIDDAIIDNDE